MLWKTWLSKTDQNEVSVTRNSTCKNIQIKTELQ